MKDRPILMSGPMVRATLEDRKTKTRRVITPQPKKRVDGLLGLWRWARTRDKDVFLDTHIANIRVDDHEAVARYCPYGQPGDRLWVRETWQQDPAGERAICYAASGHSPHCVSPGHLWRPSIFMRRSVCRLVLEITEVRVERVQEISEGDAIAEGADARILAEGVAKLAQRAKAQPLHWVGGDRGDQIGSFCRECCQKRVAKIVASGVDTFVDGGWGTEEDGAAFCADCNAFLDCSLSDYGVNQELEALERDGITTPEDAHLTHAILNYGGNPLVGEDCGGTVLRPELKGRVARLSFRTLWDSLNAKRGYGWNVDPYVWVISYRRVT